MLLCYLILVNAVLFLLMLIDKRKAVRHRWRIPEATLFLLAFLGGSLGGTLGMYLFRHKTRHPKFAIGFPVLLAVQTVLLILLMLHVPDVL